MKFMINTIIIFEKLNLPKFFNYTIFNYRVQKKEITGCDLDLSRSWYRSTQT